MRDGRSRVLIFGVAAATRLLLAAAFYGSVDITNDILDAAKMFDGHADALTVPYFPGIHLLLRIGALLILHTPIPPALAFKLFPSLFDAGIAALLMELGPPRYAWLYALAPIPLIVTSIHGQWDAVFLFFLLLAVWGGRLERRAGDVLAGAAYTLSVIAKPVAAPLLLFFFPPRDRKRMITVAISMAATTAAYLLVLQLAGMPLTLTRVRWVVQYANVGVQLIGLPELLPIPRTRTAALLALLPLLWLIWKGRISRERAILFFFLAVVGLCGIAPQYLLWAVPFALAVGEIRLAALYNLLGGVALLCYYQSPGITGPNVENLGTLAPLERLAWLSPAATSLDVKTRCVLILADLVIPLLCLAALALGIRRAMRNPVVERRVEPAPRAVAVPILALMAIVIVFAAWSMTLTPPSGDAFARVAFRRAVADYALAPYYGPGLAHPNEPALIARSFVQRTPPAPFNAFVLGLMATALWAAAAAREAARA